MNSSYRIFNEPERVPLHRHDGVMELIINRCDAYENALCSFVALTGGKNRSGTFTDQLLCGVPL